jgi:hypothetical protein
VHCVDTAEYDEEAGPIYRGWDFGLTPSCAFSQLHSNGKWVIFDEMVSDKMGADEFADEVVSYSSQYTNAEFIDIGDPAGEARGQQHANSCFDVLHGKNIHIEGGDQNPGIRIESVKKKLNMMAEGEPLFALSPRCKILRKGFMGKYRYRRMKTANEKYTDKPDKNEYSHIHDALQYVATHLFADGLRRGEKKTID